MAPSAEIRRNSPTRGASGDVAAWRADAEIGAEVAAEGGDVDDSTWHRTLLDELRQFKLQQAISGDLGGEIGGDVGAEAEAGLTHAPSAERGAGGANAEPTLTDGDADATSPVGVCDEGHEIASEMRSEILLLDVPAQSPKRLEPSEPAAPHAPSPRGLSRARRLAATARP